MVDRNLHALALGYRILGFVVIAAGVSLLCGMFEPLPVFGRIGAIVLTGNLLAALGSGLLGMWLVFLIDATAAWILFEVARSLIKSSRHTFCLVVAWLVSAYFPLGTVLGVFTIVQLSRSEARESDV